MKDKIFLDSNVIIYAHTDLDIKKKKIAQDLISSENFTYISTQVLQEVANTLSKKFKHSWADITRVIDQLKLYNIVNNNSISTISGAILIANRYNYSFYDSLIIAVAIECSCSHIYSEDMQSGQNFDGVVTICNPFIKT
jgi:predicted nucleic acid-binding protein